MKSYQVTSRSGFDSPATYRIGVQGRIPARWLRPPGRHDASRNACRKPDPPVTTLLGELSDQAALAGVLNSLYELHLPVLSVERLS